jgi:tetratricopeptide (TPR) repeat protein
VLDRLIIDLAPDGRVSVSSWLDGELPGAPAAEPFALAWPLDGEALEALRWYLEDYLRAPFGVYGDRGPDVAEALAGWGEAIFNAVFGTGPARDVYVRVRARIGAATELIFRSSSPAFLALPWELLRDPSRPTPVALDLIGVTRSIPASELREPFAARGERLRVLMVISRPAGGADVGYRMIARPLLGRLNAVRGRVDLTVLRPPTIEALEHVLAGALAEGDPFQIVHFDGHGVLTGRSGTEGSPLTLHGSSGEGLLVFEDPAGGPAHVSADKVAQVLAAARVPLVVLNACQSGAVGKELEAAVATRLLQEGAASVVAMAYSVYAVAAAEFTTAFYEALFAGERVTEAVTAGRRRLYQHNRRPSPKGRMPLADWIVPVHYLRRDVRFPYLRSRPPGRVPSLKEVLDRMHERTGEEHGELDPVGSFVGRDALFYDLEVAARLQRVVLLQGLGGTGKTELAKAFGRWWRDTAGVDRPDWVIFHSFEPGVASFALDGVVTEIGLRVFGSEFARLELRARRAAVEEVLREKRLLLIWDNFESVFTMPDSARTTPPLSDAERRELQAFVGRMSRCGRSSLVITSRTDESWLGNVRRIWVEGLPSDEANEYADEILGGFPAAAARRWRPQFGELLKWLDGHPLSMRLVLPHLQNHDPEALLTGLQAGGEPTRRIDEESGRTDSLAACVDYSFEHLTPRSRRALPAICLFHGVADVRVLAIFSSLPDTPHRFACVGDERSTQAPDNAADAGAGATFERAWTQALDDAARIGLLTKLGRGMYRVHPGLPGYLAAHWHREEPDDYARERAAATRTLLRAHAEFAKSLAAQLRGREAGFAFAVIHHEQRTFGRLLRFALDHGLWDDARAVAQPLLTYLDASGLPDEARRWVDLGRVATEDPDGSPPALDSSAGALWLMLVDSQVKGYIQSQRHDDADHWLRKIHEMLLRQPESRKRQKDLRILYHELARVAQNRRRWDEAEGWYKRSLAMSEELGDRRGTADVYHQLGIIAHEHGSLDDAKSWYAKSLAIREKLGDRPAMADSFHELGMVAQDQGRPDEAKSWYARSLAIREEFVDRPKIAMTYHELGLVAQERGRLDEAEIWYTKSLHIKEELDDPPLLASTYGQLGLLAEARGQERMALERVVKLVALFDEFPHPATEPAPEELVRLTSRLGIETLATCWQKATGQELPRPVREFVDTSLLGRGRGQAERANRDD